MAGLAVHFFDADPLTLSKADQLERLNPRAQCGMEQLHVFSLCDQCNTCHPNVDETKTYATSLDSDEWNTNCHLKVIPEDQLIAQLPRAPRKLMTLLASDYIETGRINGHCKPRCRCPCTGSIPTCNVASRSVTKKASFLDFNHSELDQKLQHRSHSSQYRITLFLVEKQWL
ncbi:hypothetical protein FGIG_00617 [Fasciola gigantica]|uniref:Uncharacterized protein n=1 Tax=Fasciola gigantica TaxID=46835 RepID=A0A504YLL1_FASGI|nr:hypothetical protein FGIG_00617 [Fasciola gigantica]